MLPGCLPGKRGLNDSCGNDISRLGAANNHDSFKLILWDLEEVCGNACGGLVAIVKVYFSEFLAENS